MTRDELATLLERSEATDLDWKSDFPPGLLAGSSSPDWATGKGTVLKDLAALGNGLSSGVGYIVYGVRDQGATREVVGKSLVLDDSDLQTWAANAFYPPLRFLYEEIVWDEDRSVGVMTVTATPDYPHVAKETLGVIHRGQVWHRRGTQNVVALYEDLERMFKGDEFMVDERSDGPIVTEAVEHYRTLGREPVLPRWNSREGKLRAGYEFAFFPGTRRLVVVIAYGHSEPDVVLMLRPADEGGVGLSDS